jgi:hypothetical protein
MDVLFGSMQRIGHQAKRLLAASATPWAGLGLVAALGLSLWMWGFTVDDSLIAVRYARHLALGFGWRFNLNGPSTDGVTPLAWPLVLAPLARANPLVVLWRSKLLGLMVWAAAGTALGAAIGRVSGAPWWGRAAALSTTAISVPIAAHAVSGMETALATALATTAVLLARRPRQVALVAGLAASLRPEMAPWAVALAVGVVVVERATVAQVVVCATLALAPFVCCAVIREVAWGRPAPLAVMAKPSDLEHGWEYAGAACVVTLTPLLALAPVALARAPLALAIVVAAIAHAMAIVVVGGDWMPYARLMVPVAPTLAYAGALVAARAHPVATAARSLAPLVLGVALIARGGTAGRRVGGDRAALVAEARPALSAARCVAALDVGWVGSATDVTILDLAGLTDPTVAALPGGHTSKRVDAMFVRSRGADALLLYATSPAPNGDLARWAEATYPRVVEARLARDQIVARHFAPAAWLPLGTLGAGYVLLRARAEESL